jgi:hypothetical protein
MGEDNVLNYFEQLYNDTDGVTNEELIKRAIRRGVVREMAGDEEGNPTYSVDNKALEKAMEEDLEKDGKISLEARFAFFLKAYAEDIAT